MNLNDMDIVKGEPGQEEEDGITCISLGGNDEGILGLINSVDQALAIMQSKRSFGLVLPTF
jgi:hypothetical protein